MRAEVDPLHECLTLVDVPLLAGVALTIQGDGFVEPVSVWVGDMPCQDAAIWLDLTTPLHSMAYNVTWSSGRIEAQNVNTAQSSSALSARRRP